LPINNAMRYVNVMMKECGNLFKVAAADGVEGAEGTAPKTVEPLEFVVFNTDELVLVDVN
jgi:hypothetical protein